MATFEEKLALAKEFNKSIKTSVSEITSLKTDLKVTKDIVEVIKSDVSVIKPK